MDLTKDGNSTADDTNHRIAPQVRDAARRVETFNDDAVDYIRENPVKCLHAAAHDDPIFDVTHRLADHLREHPYSTLAAAAGLGYLLAGGLFTRLTARLLKVAIAAGAPLALGPLLERELACTHMCARHASPRTARVTSAP